MTLLLNCHSLSKSFGAKQLFKDISFGIFRGDKIGLIGPNGSGKSTLLKILCEIESPDSGTVSPKKGLRIGYVPQSSGYTEKPIEDIVLGVMTDDHHTPVYERQTKVNILLSKLGFKDPSQLASTLSGGWKKRLDIAKELINSPDVLLLDEPTNHLDLDGIVWLESFLKSESIAFLVTSHDRYFLDNVAEKMMELNHVYPQGLFASDGNYTLFVEKRETFFENQQQFERTLASKVRGEVDWLRTSPKARTTKSTARIHSAGKLIDELAEVRTRNKQYKAKIDFEATDRQTRKLLTVKNLSKSLGGRQLFSGIDLTFTQGMRLGIVGMNGSGKTTLLKLLAGEITPDKGTLKFADGLRIVYFDQHRQMLNPNDTLRQALSPNSDTVIYRDQHIHVNSWGKRFLFNPDRLDLPVRQLSGGEKARIGIARLMLQPADLLLLDEPTNDLDIPTLETLEESLSEFPGAIALITHDRALLDRLATCVIGLGLPDEVPLLADFRQWEELLKQRKSSQSTAPNVKKTVDIKEPIIISQASQKLTYKEKKELESMEAAIVIMEQKIDKLTDSMHEHTNQNNLNELQKVCMEIDELQKELERLFHRWQELDSKAQK
ncbi:MAG TPA: ABC-F family ATP-binding cassette domain-containing protein [Parachlamydiaceae bacterium]|nr:ABC-F family ATP-binding cassette domain-containing protein [Parachlamydiaceae bacterium]